MYKYLLVFIIFFSGCIYNDDDDYEVKNFPIDAKELTYKKGDCLAFDFDSGKQYIAGIITDYSKDEGGLWYGICFTDYSDTIIPSISTIATQNLYGRKVHSSVDAKGYYICIDNEATTDSCLKAWIKKVRYIGAISLAVDKIEIGAMALQLIIID